VSGTEWEVVSVAKVTDGDTVRLVRRRQIDVDGRRYWLTDVTSESIRLVWVDTPEKGDHPGWENARADLATWVSHRIPLGAIVPRGLRVVCYESAGWDRLLGDLIDADGNSASQWLMTERGWPPYVG
jgi:endonuclease YncB( thermonuclease family)